MIKKIFGSLAVTALFAAPMMTGCGSSGVSSGVDGTKKGNELSEDETSKVCNAVIDYRTDAFAGVTQADSCKFAGYLTAATLAAFPGATDASIQEACQGIVDPCLAAKPTDGSNSGETPADVCKLVTPTTVKTCTATVGDIETCVAEQTDATTDSFKNAPACADITIDSLKEAKPAEQSNACNNVSSDCAVLFTLLGGTPAPGGDDGAGGAGGGQ